MLSCRLTPAIDDVKAALGSCSIAGILGWHDVRQRYRRSVFGMLWHTLNTGIMIGTIALVFGQIFRAPLQEFLPFLSVGLIFWGFISSVISEGCVGFISAESIIRQQPIPFFVHILRILWRNTLILAHNIVIFPLVLLGVGKSLTWTAILCLPGYLVLTVNLAWAALFASVVCARYRDLTPIVANALQVIFYLTPIMWLPSLLTERGSTFLISGNPLHHLLELVRAPLLGQTPSSVDWAVGLVMAVLGWSVTLELFGRYRGRIAYWL